MISKLDLLNTKIQSCIKCKLCELECNKKDISKGFGKLYGWKGGTLKCRFFFIGINPSHSRFPEHEFAFGGIEGSPGAGKKFNHVLRETGFFEEIFVDNIVHCSSFSNMINYHCAKECFEYLHEEIKILNPEKIISLGKSTFDILSQLFVENNIQIPIENVWHPSYVFSYNKSTPEKYKEIIVKACQGKNENNFYNR